MFRSFCFLCFFVLFSFSAAPAAPAAPAARATNPSKTITMSPYPTTRQDATVDHYFGTSVADPYRWLEDDHSPQRADWVCAQNEVTQEYLSRIPFREEIHDRLRELWNYPKYGLPQWVGGYYFFTENNGLQNQSVLYRSVGLEGPAELFLDPNALSSEGTTALVHYSFSQDCRYMAYATAEAGSDWVLIRVMETQTGRRLPDEIRWVKFSGAEWCGDGFYYSAYDPPGEEGPFSAQNRFQKVYYHRLGELQSHDRLIYEDPAHPLRYFHAQVSEDERHLFITATEGTDGAELYYRTLSEADTSFRLLFEGFVNNYSLITCRQGEAIFHTNAGAPNYSLIQLSLQGTTPQSHPFVSEDPDRMLETVTTVGGTLLLHYLDKAVSAVEQYDLHGHHLRSVTLPGLGSVVSASVREPQEPTAFFAFSSFTSPAAIYRFDSRHGESELFKAPEFLFDPDDFVTREHFFPSKDGTQVSMFLFHRKGITLDGSHPLYLYGYGGFNISLTPDFSPQRLLLAERGAIFAMVNLRGGGEYGEAWHRAGMLECKQTVFDDFIAAAEYLIAQGYTSSDRLGIAGGSNGGLLVGACMTQRPDLYAVALPAVGVLDMLRFHQFTVGWGWVVEYGSSATEEGFRYLYAYSPLHNIRSGVCYPATLITTGDHDDRVVPAHSFKFAATLQAAQSQNPDCHAPALIRIDTNAGHGAGKPTSKRIEEAADVLSFFFWNTRGSVHP